MRTSLQGKYSRGVSHTKAGQLFSKLVEYEVIDVLSIKKGKQGRTVAINGNHQAFIDGTLEI